MPETELRKKAELLEQLTPLMMQALFSHPDDPMSQTPVGQLRILRQLTMGSKSPGKIAEDLGLTPGAVTQHVARLKVTGMVVENPDPNDRRVKMIQLSEIGKEKMQTRSVRRIEKATRVLSRVSLESQEALMKAIQAILAASTEKS